MSKLHEQIRALLRSPKHLMMYQGTGRLPEVAMPDSPLIDLIESLPKPLWAEFTGIRLDPSVGYRSSGHVFVNLHNLYQWLKPGPSCEPGSYPADIARLAHFYKPLTIADLLPLCDRIPPQYRRYTTTSATS